MKPDGTIAIVMPMFEWTIIDGTLDNASSNAVTEGDPDGVVPRCRMIREAGWRDLGGWTPEHKGHGWPPADQEIAMSLSHEHWIFIAGQLEGSIPIDEEVATTRKPGSRDGLSIGYSLRSDALRRARAERPDRRGQRRRPKRRSRHRGRDPFARPGRVAAVVDVPVAYVAGTTFQINDLWMRAIPEAPAQETGAM